MPGRISWRPSIAHSMDLSLLSNPSRSDSVEVDTSMSIGRSMRQKNLSVQHRSRSCRVRLERIDRMRVEVSRIDLLALEFAGISL